MVVLTGRRAQEFRPSIGEVTTSMLTAQRGTFVLLTTGWHHCLFIRPPTSIVTNVRRGDLFLAATFTRRVKMGLARTQAVRAFSIGVDGTSTEVFVRLLTTIFRPTLVRRLVLNAMECKLRNFFGPLSNGEVVSQRGRLTTYLAFRWQRVVDTDLGNGAVRFLSGATELSVHLFLHR